jgi:NAD(P)-dependent dehydrogenase (short-subunit alcohol dehydrogenase family)
MSLTTRRTAAALAAGIVLGATTAAGNALLLYTGQGFLRAAGLLVSSAIMAVAAGVWAGTADPDEGEPVQSRGRWVSLIIALLAGGAFTAAWSTYPVLRELALGGAVAVLLVLALPAYAAGTVLMGLNARERASLPEYAGGSVAAAAVAGAALGVLLATTVLIQTLEPYGIYYAGAAVLTLAAAVEWQRSEPGKAAVDMRGHVAIVTGVGAREQVGYAVAARLIEAGARVVVTDIADTVEKLAGELGDADRVVAVQADLTNDEDAARVVATARERYGRLDSLVNVAGGLTVVGPVAGTTSAEWQREIQRNGETVLCMTRAALPLLRETAGSIVNFASPAGVHAVANLGAYSAAKACVIALTRAVAVEEMGHGVRANALAPGAIDTAQNRAEMGEGAAFVSRDEITGVVLFLAGAGSRGVSGETIHVAGRTLGQ